MNNIYRQLFERHLITEKQFDFLDAIHGQRIISLYFELRLMLYLGIMLFTAGVGYFAYQNLGDMGHILSMILIAAAATGGFYYINKIALPYSSDEVKINHPFFDYLLILSSLLLISLLVYIMIYFDMVSQMINFTSITSAVILFAMAYRYDNVAVLSMGITALAAAAGVSISPINWAQGEWFPHQELYQTSMLLGVLLIVGAEITSRKAIKKHFKFTYQNFGLLLFFIGAITALFTSESPTIYALLLLLSSGAVIYYAWTKKAFLFFLYSNIAAYITITYLLFQLLDHTSDGVWLLIYYFPVSCILYIIFLVKNKSHFSND